MRLKSWNIRVVLGLIPLFMRVNSAIFSLFGLDGFVGVQWILTIVPSFKLFALSLYCGVSLANIMARKLTIRAVFTGILWVCGKRK